MTPTLPSLTVFLSTTTAVGEFHLIHSPPYGNGIVPGFDGLTKGGLVGKTEGKFFWAKATE